MTEYIAWFSDALTNMQKAGQIATVLFFVTFCAIIIYVFTGKRRKQRLESYKYIPFADDEQESRTQRKVDDDE